MVGSGGGGVRVDVNEEVKYCENSKEKYRGWGVWRIRLGVKVDVNKDLTFL